MKKKAIDILIGEKYVTKVHITQFMQMARE